MPILINPQVGNLSIGFFEELSYKRSCLAFQNKIIRYLNHLLLSHSTRNILVVLPVVLSHNLCEKEKGYENYHRNLLYGVLFFFVFFAATIPKFCICISMFSFSDSVSIVAQPAGGFKYKIQAELSQITMPIIGNRIIKKYSKSHKVKNLSRSKEKEESV